MPNVAVNTSLELRFRDATIINASVTENGELMRKDIAIAIYQENGFSVHPIVELDCLSMRRLATMIERDGKELLKPPKRE
jgi:hypothetical protein